MRRAILVIAWAVLGAHGQVFAQEAAQPSQPPECEGSDCIICNSSDLI